MAARLSLRALRALPGALARSLVRLRRFPPVLAAVVGAGIVVGIAAATGPMVVSSAGNAAIAERIGGPDAPPVGLRTQTRMQLTWDRVAYRLPLIRDAVRGLPLGPPEVSVLGSEAAAVATARGQAPVQMVTRSGYLDHVRRVAGGGSNGLWVPSSVARTLRLRPGGTATLVVGSVSTRFRVAGVYRDIDPYHVPSYWSPVVTRIAPAPGDDPPPPFLMGDLRPFLDTERDVLDEGTVEIQVAVPHELSLREARWVGAALDRVTDGLIDPMSPVYRAFDTADSLLPALVEQADQTVVSTTQPVQAISLAGELAALILAAAGGMFLARRRSVEFALLSARGVRSSALGARTAVEALLPSVAGGVAGLALARALTSATGPGGPVDAEAVRSASVRGAMGALAAAIVVGAFTAVAVRMEAPDRTVRGRAAPRAPWELILLALAGASAYEIFTRGTGAVDAANGQPPSLDLLVLAFPFLFVAGAAGLAVRLFRRALPRLRAAAQGRRPWVFLTAARVAGAPRLASVLVLVAGLAVGVLTYSNVLSASVAATADIKAILTVGTDVVATTGALPTIRGRAPFQWAPVEQVPSVTLGESSGPQVDVMAVDPRSFARAAAWVGPFSGPPDALDALDAGGPVPAITVGTALPADARLTLNGGSVPVRAVASMDGFPGVQPANPTLIVDLKRLTAVSPSLAGAEHSYELWARGDPAVILPVLRREGFDPTYFVTARRERSAPGFEALSWTFGLLQTFGALAGLLSVLGAVLYLQARQQQREVTYALARRMGLRRNEHRRSIALELAGMLLAAYVIGAGFATAAAAIVHRKIDPLPSLPPGPLFRVPVGALVALAGAAAALAWAGAMRVQRRADRANVGELLRRAG